eukprot:g6550.t2
MTLVDLPGITRVPVADQPSDIESVLHQMIISYIQHPTCIILAVSAANDDLANSVAISTAKSVDPEGTRTIGVVTKLDIMDPGTNAVALLKNEVVPLQLGYIGIINRSQRDISNNIDIKTACRNEDIYFQNNNEYYEVIHRCGVENLAKNLNKILTSHIERLFPDLRRKIGVQIERKDQEMKLYGDAQPANTPMEQGVLILGLLSDYTRRFRSLIDGKSETIILTLSGGAKIRDIFQNEFRKSLDETISRIDLSTETVSTVVKNNTGISGSLVIPQEPFEVLVHRSITTLLEPSIYCKDSVQQELLKIANNCVSPELFRFNYLQTMITDCAVEFIKSGGLPAEEMIRNLIDCESEYINYDHKDFIQGTNVIAEIMFHREFLRSLPEHRLEELSSQTELSSEQEDIESQVVLSNTQNSVNNLPKTTPEEREAEILQTENHTESERKRRFRPKKWLGNILRKNGDQQVKKESQASPSVGILSNLVRPLKQPVSLRSNDLSESFSIVIQNETDLAVAITKKLVDKYMAIVQCNIEDLVPKIITKFLVNRSKEGLQQYLVTKLYRADLFERLVSEKPEMAAKRKQCSETLEALRNAMSELESLPRTLSQHGAFIDS